MVLEFMKRVSTNFVCQECGYDSPQWYGKCPECGTWNSMREITINSSQLTINKKKSARTGSVNIKPQQLSEIIYNEKERTKTGFSELDGVLGGGIVAGSVTLLAGDPGIGKSTLLLQTALNISNHSKVVLSPPSGGSKDPMGLQKKAEEKILRSAQNDNLKVLYVSGEESAEQIKLRATRIIGSIEQKNFLLLALSDTDAIVEIIQQTKPALVIIDSIQTMESEQVGGLSGSVGQIRYGANAFIRLAKQDGVPIVLVGHVTKEGMVAGPMILSHMVDTVLFFEGEKMTATRILRSLKNRFGPVDEVGVFTMEQNGVKEVTNPEQIFLTEKRENVPGSVLSVILEGTRAFLIELQGLVVFSKLPMPRRVSSGFDSRRLELLLAVLQKHCRLPLETSDVFVNVAGGMKVNDPAVDLAVCLALFSSLKNMPLKNAVGIAEVGLLGELRGVGSLEKRIKEAKKLGFGDIISAKTNKMLNEVITSFK